MLVAGYLGEVGSVNVWVGFVIGMLGWLYIIYEIFAGEASQINAKVVSQKAFNALRLVTVGWAIYPIGYVVGYTGGGSAEGRISFITLLTSLIK